MNPINPPDDFSDESLWAFVERTDLNGLNELSACRDREKISKIWYGDLAEEATKIPVTNVNVPTTNTRLKVAQSLQSLAECPSRYALHLAVILSIWAVGFGMGGWFFSVKRNVQVAVAQEAQVPVIVAHKVLPEPTINPFLDNPFGRRKAMMTHYDKDLGAQKIEDQLRRPRLIRALQWYRDEFVPEESRPNSQMQGPKDPNSVEFCPLNQEESAAFESLIQALYKTIAKDYPEYRP
jgi:hypothetical protein